MGYDQEKELKARFDNLYNIIIRNTVYGNLTNDETDRLSSIFDQHTALLNIGSYLLEAGINTKFAITDWRRTFPDFIKRRIKDIHDHQIDLLGLTMTSVDYHTVQKTAFEIKKVFPDLKIVVGGCHPSFVAAKILEESPAIDYCVMGPGANSMLMLAQNRDESEIPSLAYRKNGKITVNPKLSKHSEILTFPYPLKYEKALEPFRKFPLARFFSKIGCKMDCYYCCDKVWTSNVFEMNFQAVKEEALTLFHTRDTRYFYINDQDAFSDPESFRPVYRLMSQLRSIDDRLRYSVQVSAHSLNKISEEDLLEIGKSGCNWFQIGLESVDTSLNSKTTQELFEKAVKKVKNTIPETNITAYCIVGLPGDSYEKTMRTMDYVNQLSKKDYITAFRCRIFSPFPATSVYRNPEQYNIVIDDSDWRYFGYDYFGPPRYHYKNWSSEEIFDTYYKAIAYANQIFEDKIEQLGLKDKPFMPFYNVV
ncbi:MAG: cobalamin-dependent protein [Firmicutes bacterium]|nr:cobalamin-dependent protein [Bacillota bacterium]